MPSWFDAISSLGLPAALLVLFLWGTYRIARPIVDRIADAVVGLITELRAALSSQADMIREIRNLLEQQGRSLDELAQHRRHDVGGRNSDG